MANELDVASTLRTSIMKADEAQHAGRGEVALIHDKQRAPHQTAAKNLNVKLAVDLDRVFHARLKSYAVNNFQKLEDVVRMALDDFLKAHEA